MQPVLSKTDFVSRYSRGEFGNRSPTWNTLDEFYEIRNWIYLPGLYHLRNRVAGGPTYYNVTANAIPLTVDRMLKKGVKVDDIYVSEMCPTERTVLQGEVMRRPGGLYLYYSVVKKPMRDSLRDGGRGATGLLALSLLRYALNQSSYEWMEYLLDTYDDHVVEFTALNQCWGTEPGYNTLFWEVRNY